MPLVTITHDIEVYCACGAGLCGQSKGGDGHVTVDPCEKCLYEADQEGLNMFVQKLRKYALVPK